MSDPEAEHDALTWHEDDPDSYLWVVERPGPTGRSWAALRAQRKRDSGLDEHM